MYSSISSFDQPCVFKINTYALLMYMSFKINSLIKPIVFVIGTRTINNITIGKQIHSKICLNVIFFEKYNLVQVSINTSTKTIKM